MPPKMGHRGTVKVKIDSINMYDKNKVLSKLILIKYINIPLTLQDEYAFEFYRKVLT